MRSSGSNNAARSSSKSPAAFLPKNGTSWRQKQIHSSAVGMASEFELSSARKALFWSLAPRWKAPRWMREAVGLSCPRLANEMIKTRAKFFLVEVPRTKFAERFSLKDAATHLKNEFGHGESIYEECV